MYILVPSGLKNTPLGLLASPAMLKFCRYVKVDMFQGVPRSYSFTSSPLSPTKYIFVPSGLKNISQGLLSSKKTEADFWLSVAVATSHAVLTSNSDTRSSCASSTYIFVPSGLNFVARGIVAEDPKNKLCK